MKNKENLELLAEKICQVDAVLIGGGSGLSSAAGYNHYHWMPYLEGQLQDFKEAYGFQSPFSGFYPRAAFGFSKNHQKRKRPPLLRIFLNGIF